jgi:hypothetical protein
MKHPHIVEDLIDEGKWLVFAVGGTDRRRSFYWNAIARCRSAEMATRRAERHRLPVPPVEIAADRGFQMFDSETFTGTSQVVHEVQHLAAEQMPQSVTLTTPDQFGSNLRDLSFSSPLVQFAVSESLMAPIAAYLGMVPILTGIQIMRASYIQDPPSGSQLFHCDHDDLRQVKVFVLCSEVSDDNGPLTVLDASASRRVKQALHYRYGGRSLRIADEQVDELASVTTRTAFSGPPGRVLLVDTSTCLHFGARIRKGAADRLMVQFQYLTPAAFELLFRPDRRRICLPGPESSRLHRLVLGEMATAGRTPPALTTK